MPVFKLHKTPYQNYIGNNLLSEGPRMFFNLIIFNITPAARTKTNLTDLNDGKLF